MQFRDLKRDAPYWEAAFHARLSRSVSQLGYGVERTKNGWEVAGFSRDTLEKFSRRTAEIEKVAAEKGITSAEEKAQLGARTREAKGESRSLDSLKEEWVGRLGADERRALADVSGQRVRSREPAATVGETLTHAKKHGFERQSVLSEKRLLAEALKRGYGSVEVEEVKRSFSAGRGCNSPANGRANAGDHQGGPGRGSSGHRLRSRRAGDLHAAVGRGAGYAR